MTGPRVLLMTRSERASARGMPYMSRWLGKANVVAFKADEPDRYGNPQWEVYVAEPQQNAEPATNNAERGQAGWDRSRDVTRHVERSRAAESRPGGATCHPTCSGAGRAAAGVARRHRRHAQRPRIWAGPMSAIEVSAEQMAAFVDALFRHADLGSWISLRGFRDDKDDEPPVSIKAVPMNGDLGKIAAEAVGIARYCATYRYPAVFCPPVATFGDRKKATEAALANGLALSVEIDDNPERSRKRLEFLLGPATVVVASGGVWTNPETGEAQSKLHLHWRLKEPTRTPEAHARLKRARTLATALVGGDASNKPVVHPIRWPGSVHRKREPKLCRIVAINPDAEIDLQAGLGILLDIQPEFRNQGSTGKEPGDGEDRETSELVRALMTGADYHSTLLALSMRFLKRGMPADQVGLTLRGLMEAIPVERRDGDQPGRWQARYADIGRTIRQGQAKLAEQPAADAWPEPLDVIGAPELVGWPELPPECLPVPIYRYVMAEAERLNVDPCPLAGHVLAACSASISDGWRIKPKRHDHWTQQARVWCCVVKDVGQRGTEMIRSGFWPVKERDATAFEQWQRERWRGPSARPGARKAMQPRTIPSPSCAGSPRQTPRSKPPRRSSPMPATATQSSSSSQTN